MNQELARSPTHLQIYQAYLDKSTPFITQRWIGTAVLFLIFGLRIVFAQGWYIGMGMPYGFVTSKG